MTDLTRAAVIPTPALARDLRRPKGERLELTGSVVIADPMHGRAFIVPAGFRFDGHSAPWLTRPSFSSDTLGDRGAVAHDWIYRHAGALPCGTVYTRAEADRLYFELLLVDGVAPWRARLAYWGVRAGGWRHWRPTDGR